MRSIAERRSASRHHETRAKEQAKRIDISAPCSLRPAILLPLSRNYLLSSIANHLDRPQVKDRASSVASLGPTCPVPWSMIAQLFPFCPPALPVPLALARSRFRSNRMAIESPPWHPLDSRQE